MLACFIAVLKTTEILVFKIARDFLYYIFNYVIYNDSFFIRAVNLQSLLQFFQIYFIYSLHLHHFPTV